jgi:hypothetical protein
MDHNLMNMFFRDPQTVVETLNRLRREAQSRGEPRPQALFLNPDLISNLTLFGLPVVWDTSLARGEIRLEARRVEKVDTRVKYANHFVAGGTVCSTTIDSGVSRSIPCPCGAVVWLYTSAPKS